MTFIFCSSVCVECEAPILFYFVFRGYPEREFNHRYHQNEEKDEVEWHYLKAYSIAEQPEQRGNEGRADIGARHLYSDYSARVFRPEVVRSGVYYARIYRRAAEPDYDKSRGGEEIRIHRHEQAAYAAKENCRSRYYHPAVAELIRDKPAYKPPDCDAYVEKRRECSRALCGYALYFNEICARPLHGGRFCGAVGKKACEQERHALYFQRADESDALFLRLFCHLVDLPHGQGHEQENRYHELQRADYAAAAVPGLVCQRIAHDKRADYRPDAPEAVQPAHVLGLVVQGDVVIERRVYRARAETVGHGKNKEQPKPVRKREAEQRKNGQKYAEHRDYPRPEPSVQPVGHQTRSYRAAGYDHGDDAHIRNRHSELEVHDGPARAEKRIGQSEADKGKIDKCKQKRIHFGSP